MNALLRNVLAAMSLLGALNHISLAHAADRPNTVGAVLGASRPASVPADYVVTPNGYFHPSCVVELDEGDKGLPDGSILRANGHVEAATTCAYPHFTPQAPIADIGSSSIYNGYLAYSDTDRYTSPAVGALLANWNVPAAPATVSGQTLFFFPGLVPSDDTFIIQPVLGWNAFKGNPNWSISSWNCCTRGTIEHSRAIDVNAGDSLRSETSATSCTAGSACSSWVIVTTDATLSTSTTLDTSSLGEMLPWVFGGTMETYGVLACDQFPASGGVTFTGIEVYDENFNLFTPTWTSSTAATSSTVPACNYAVQTTATTSAISFSTTP